MQRILAVCLLFALPCSIMGQKQAAKWYFADKLGLDFLTSPPTLLTDGAMETNEGSSSISDANGNLVLYTDGDTVWNKFHQPVANGTGLASGQNCWQHLIVAKPAAADIFYVFTTDEPQLPPYNGFNYSIVDVSLASGNGSVTTKNQQLITECTEQVAAVKHCNGTDISIIACSFQDGAFMSYLLTAAGLNTVAVKSVVSPTVQRGSILKMSPTGQRLAMGDFYSAGFALYDFDNSTGMVSNQRKLSVSTSSFAMTFGCEFSPDGSRLYGVADSFLFQWDLCATSDSALQASRDSFQLNSANIALLQVAIDGKIYCNPGTAVKAMDVIGNPNAALPACNYSAQALYLGNWYGGSMPYFVSSYFRQPLPPFSHSITCGTASFFPPPPLCSAQSRSVTGKHWFFGDTASGSANTSSFEQPTHLYSAPGAYTVDLVLQYGCGSDTIRQVIQVVDVPTISLVGDHMICKGEATTFSVTGATSYSWNGTPGAATVAFSPASNAVYTVSGTGTNGCYGSKVFSVAVDPCLGTAEVEGHISDALVYPNPSRDNFTVVAPANSVLTVRDLTGRLLISQLHGDARSLISLAAYADGLYLLEVKSTSGLKVLRLHKSG